MFGESERTRKAREGIGMPSKQGGQWGSNASPSTLLKLSGFALIAYPIGAILPLMSDVKYIDALGLIIVATAALACVPIFSSRLYKIASTEKLQLDEFEMQLRLKSILSAYVMLTALIGLGLFYLMLAGDTGLWMPSVESHLNGIFWGYALYALLLPVTVLAWRMRKSPVD